MAVFEAKKLFYKSGEGGGGGGTPVIDTLNVTPSTSAQVINAPSGVDGYSPVNVSAVDSSIDANILSNNIIQGVTILGVSGSAVELNGETKTVTPQVYGQTLYPTSPKNGITEITVNAVTSSIDANITAGNIKKDVTILGVTGNYEGSAPSGTVNITSNGTHDVSAYASADVQVPTTVPDFYLVRNKVGTELSMPSSPPLMSFSGITKINEYALEYAYCNATNMTGVVDMSSVTTIVGSACYYAFYKSGITGVNLSGLTRLYASALTYAFAYTSNLSCAIDLTSLTTVDNYALQYCFFLSAITSIDVSGYVGSATTTSAFNSICKFCYYLTSADFSSIVEMNLQSAFEGCSALTTVKLDSIRRFVNANCGSKTFASCTSLQHLYFPALLATGYNMTTNKACIKDMLSGVTGCTIHFPKNLDPQTGNQKISGMTGYPNFGGTNTVLLYDLPSTNNLVGVDTITYERNPKYDTATALAWQNAASYEHTPQYYTSGLTDPQVSDTIYSDAACTVAVTTIDSIIQY